MRLRIAFNITERRSPYGGGNQFANALEDRLRAAGHDVFRQLVPDLDIILIIGLRQASFDIPAIAAYKRAYPKTKVVHRVNDSDLARGGGDEFTRAVTFAQPVADHTVFVSDYIRRHYAELGVDPIGRSSVILNGADETHYHAKGKAPWKTGERIRIVTHHWSTSYLKGFDVYERLDQMLERASFAQRFEFTCIGNRPAGVDLPQSRCLPVLYGASLADELRGHHLYLSAARREAAGNHYIEALQCGLPVLFLESGSLPEYCGTSGIGFRLADFEEALAKAADQLPRLEIAARNCDLSATRTTGEYLALFLRLAGAAGHEGASQANLAGRCAYAAFRARRALGTAKRLVCTKLCGIK